MDDLINLSSEKEGRKPHSWELRRFLAPGALVPLFTLSSSFSSCISLQPQVNRNNLSWATKTFLSFISEAFQYRVTSLHFWVIGAGSRLITVFLKTL